MNQTKTIKTFAYGDEEIKLAIPVDIDIKYFDENAAVLLFAVVQEQLKKLIGQLAIRPLKEAEET